MVKEELFYSRSCSLLMLVSNSLSTWQEVINSPCKIINAVTLSYCMCGALKKMHMEGGKKQQEAYEDENHIYVVLLLFLNGIMFLNIALPSLSYLYINFIIDLRLKFGCCK